MSLSAGTRLGPYEILSLLGSGGMGEVYRARDTKLDREVAIKILPELFVSDPERVARFQREAKTLAALNHPHIGSIYGLEDAEGVRALVLELVEGPTLADRIAQGPIALEDALPIAQQIAQALEAAHDAGIIHRDLKPANIKVREDGTVKVLDFGLAKLADPAAVEAQPGAAMSQSPTITTPAMTAAGMILGTAAYMSPEQAKGRAADKRSDIWAFGCVLYEMLTGKRPFIGEDISDTLAAVLRGEPEWAALPANTPQSVRTLLRRCLQKDPKKRLPHIGVARLEVDEADASAPLAGDTGAAAHPRAWRRAIPFVIAAAVASLVTAFVLLRAGTGRRGTAVPVQRLAITLPPTALLLQPSAQFGGPAISADGTRIVYVAIAPDGSHSLYLRLLDQLDPRPLPGTENGGDPFFAPDGETVAFFSRGAGTQDQALKKVTVRGGAPATIASLQGLPAGSCWGADGNIRLSLTRGSAAGPGSLQSVFVIAGAGGSLQPIPALAAAEGRSYGWPDVLPDGKHMLISVRTGPLYSDAHVDVTSLDGQVVRTVIDNGYHARYVASGHIVYMYARNLMAVPFDLSTLRSTGSPVMIAEGIGSPGVPRGAETFDVSQTGVLVHGGVMTSANAPRRAMVWVDRTGREEAIPAAQRAYTYPRISPDGSRVAIDIRDQANDIWIWDLNRHNLSRVTTNPSQDYYPVWTPDGKRLVFSSQRGGNFNLYVQNADGTGDADRLTESSSVQAAQSITPDGTQVVFREQSLQTEDDLMAVSMNDRGIPPKQRRVVALVRTNFNERNGEVSPDGRWLAYESDESGREEVYVRPFPDTAAGRWTISSDGGSRAVWARNGRELFYVVGTQPTPIHLMRVAVDTTKGFSAGVPQQLFEGRYYVDPSPTVRGRTYDVARDGQRFIMVKDMESPQRPATPQQLVVVVNWQEELKQRVPTR